MKTKPYNDEKFGWGHLFIIAVMLFLCYTTARHCGLIRDGKKPPVNQSEITVKGFNQ